MLAAGGVAAAALAAGAAANWTVVAGVDSCGYDVPGHSWRIGSFPAASGCADACAASGNCTQWSYNTHTPPHNCFGSVDRAWAAIANAHVTSGCLPAAVAGCGAAPPPLPTWRGAAPDPGANASAGLPPVPGARHATVYNATVGGAPNPFGTYNHGPIVTFFDGLYYMSWYNSPRDESKQMRSVYATSVDGEVWSAPAVLFDNYTGNGEENGPWTILNGRLYTQSGDQDAGKHVDLLNAGHAGLMRRVSADPSELGPVFWANRTVPRNCGALCHLPTYVDVGGDTAADVSQFLASAVRTVVGARDEMSRFNERSLYLVPGSRRLVCLLRGGGPKNLWGSVCELPAAPAVPDGTLFSCRPGVGDVFYNLVELLAPPGRGAEGPRTCNWSAPALTTLPDSHSRTCASALPDGSVYLVGNQITKGRDPVTVAVARDGMAFTEHWAVRYGAPPVRYPGHAKGAGFQYPGAMVRNGEMIISYSIGKEDIGLTRFPLSSIGR